MYELIGRLVAGCGVDRAAADRAVDDIVIMSFVRETARKHVVGDTIRTIAGLGPSV
jgi:hypothetical protein